MSGEAPIASQVLRARLLNNCENVVDSVEASGTVSLFIAMYLHFRDLKPGDTIQIVEVEQE